VGRDCALTDHWRMRFAQMFAILLKTQLNKRWCSQLDGQHCIKPDTTEEQEGEWIADSDPSITVCPHSSCHTSNSPVAIKIYCVQLRAVMSGVMPITCNCVDLTRFASPLSHSSQQHLFDSVQHAGQN